jgi:chaperonin GroEL
VDAIKNSPTGVGYDAQDNEFGNMIDKGIIDPTKVVRSALQNAASIAAMVLITKMPPMPPGGGMGGMEGMY